MKIAEKMAGYTLGEADILRSAMSKKKESILLKEKEKFINGSINNGYDKELANKVYNTILKFAGYGFNKSHAVVYSLIAYRMAFLKVHFYNYFMLSVLNNAINNEEKTSGYISQLRSKSVLVMNPDINMSLLKYTIYDKKIICPLSIIRNVGNNIASIIINEREKGEYVSFTDFVTRMYNNKSVNRKVLESLILAGAFSSFGYNKCTLMLNLDNIINYAELVSDSTLIEIDEPLIDIASEYSKEELVKMEFDVFGFYLSMHPVSRYRSSNKMTTLLIEDNVNRYISIVLEIINVREVITKKNDVMAFVYAGDEYRQVELTIFPDVYKEYNRIKKHDIVCVYGKVEKRLDNYQIVVSKLKVLSEE